MATMQDIIPCDCGYEPSSSSPPPIRPHCNKIGMHNHISYPALCDIPHESDLSSSIYCSYDGVTITPKRHWVLMAEYQGGRIKTRFSEVGSLAFDAKSRSFSDNLVDGCTVCVLYPISSGARDHLRVVLYDTSTIHVFKATLSIVMAETDKLLRDADNLAERGDGALRTCFACGKMETTYNEFSTCSHCNLARYCSPECQIQNLESHGSICSDFNLLLKLAGLHRHACVSRCTFDTLPSFKSQAEADYEANNDVKATGGSKDGRVINDEWIQVDDDDGECTYADAPVLTSDVDPTVQIDQMFREFALENREDNQEGDDLLQALIGQMKL